jgi:hypothetical protein
MKTLQQKSGHRGRFFIAHELWLFAQSPFAALAANSA